VTSDLQKAYPKKKFTLDGRLVGDIGEMLVEAAYDVDVFEGLRKHHDARCPRGRKVQIKATMKDSLTFPADHVPDYFLGIQIRPDGSFREIFNGPGSIAKKAVAGRKRPQNNLHSVAVSAWRNLNQSVPSERRLARRRE